MIIAQLIANLLAAALLMWRGTRGERAVVALLAVYVVTTPLLETLAVGTFRAGVFTGEVVLFLGMWWVAERLDRWWLVLIAGAQVIALVSHLIPFLIPDLYVWTDVAIRHAVWVAITTFLLFGAWETWAIQKLAAEGRARDKRVDIRKGQRLSEPLVR